MDIGGSLAKIAYYSTVPSRKILYGSEDTATEENKGDGGVRYVLLVHDILVHVVC